MTDGYTEYTFTCTKSRPYVFIGIDKDNPYNLPTNLGAYANYKLQINDGNTAKAYTPYKKYGYNSKESMGSIVVDDISCKNKFNIQNPEPYNSTVASMSSNSITFSNAGAYAQLKYHHVLKKNTNYTLKYTFETTNPEFVQNVDIQGNNTWQNSIVTKYGAGTYTLNFNSGNYDTIDIVFAINGETNLTNTGTLSNVILCESTDDESYCEYKGIGYTSGSNANGKWVKYDDGRLECWGKASIPANQTYVDITYPQQFHNVNSDASINIMITDIYSYSYYNVYTVAQMTNNGFQVFAFTAAGGTPTFQRDFYFSVKGYWK